VFAGTDITEPSDFYADAGDERVTMTPAEATGSVALADEPT
jgi:hypothetical protein